MTGPKGSRFPHIFSIGAPSVPPAFLPSQHPMTLSRYTFSDSVMAFIQFPFLIRAEIRLRFVRPPRRPARCRFLGTDADRGTLFQLPGRTYRVLPYVRGISRWRRQPLPREETDVVRHERAGRRVRQPGVAVLLPLDVSVHEQGCWNRRAGG